MQKNGVMCHVNVNVRMPGVAVTQKEHRRYMKKDMKFQYDTRVQRDAEDNIPNQSIINATLTYTYIYNNNKKSKNHPTLKKKYKTK